MSNQPKHAIKPAALPPHSHTSSSTSRKHFTKLKAMLLLKPHDAEKKRIAVRSTQDLRSMAALPDPLLSGMDGGTGGMWDGTTDNWILWSGIGIILRGLFGSDTFCDTMPDGIWIVSGWSGAAGSTGGAGKVRTSCPNPGCVSTCNRSNILFQRGLISQIHYMHQELAPKELNKFYCSGCWKIFQNKLLSVVHPCYHSKVLCVCLITCPSMKAVSPLSTTRRTMPVTWWPAKGVQWDLV